MLSRTAENLFWIGRSLERADKVARMMEVGYRLSLIPRGEDGHHNEWASILSASGASVGFAEKYGDDPTRRDAETWLFFDRDNPSSVASCVGQARGNARAVRTAVTMDMWEALNGAYLEMKDLERQPRRSEDMPKLTDWAKRQAALVRGAAEGTLLQNDGYDFLNLGMYIERADNTARLLDVKYYILLPTADMVGGGMDTLQWTTLLRSLSALRAFHHVYGGEHTPSKIADFLILNAACPRSLVHCMEQVNSHLDHLGQTYGYRGQAHERATRMLASMAKVTAEDIFSDGLHEFLANFLGDAAELSHDIAETYLFGGR